ncbi:helix-turn-helix domain-containing protein [Schaalia suimastitidis]|uniref:helix-turn-helix domain-containing protein n=1 Tax=Schaalia suimastitidis TaxID=121163 RepID=UPI000402C95C|nr:helix-turn-helix transcriptional regulator [Schaalia suimastitidis]
MIRVKLDTLLAQKGLSVKDFADAVGLTPVNVSILKNGRARAIRFSTLESICQVLQCQPADLLEYVPTKDDSASTFDV